MEHAYHAFAVNESRTEGMTMINTTITPIDIFCSNVEKLGWWTYVTELDWEPAPED